MTGNPRPLGSPILGGLDAPNFLTLTGLALAVLSVMCAVREEFHAALVCLIGAGVADLFDGFLARRSVRGEVPAAVGKHLDSLCDVCSFGFAPAILAYCYGLREPWQVLVLVAYVAAGALRLAYFDAVGLSAQGDRQAFTGMPITYGALFVPLAFLGTFREEPVALIPELALVYALLAVAMVSGAKVPKPTGVWYVIFGLLAVVMAGVYGWAAWGR
ncbi:MAG: CDP-alcohol phosphatidyltransferase family protein [Candidatus Sericytochromatia bacterium]|nr:CDP-alcohol phosphatidyltransferase family protein [Candidatus Tanganyikabacteria bacterium]